MIDKNKYFISLLLENNYHGDVLVTINASGLLKNVYMEPAETVFKNEKWMIKTSLTVSAIEAGTSRVLQVNGKSVIYLKPTMEKPVVLKILNIKGDTKYITDITRYDN